MSAINTLFASACVSLAVAAAGCATRPGTAAAGPASATAQVPEPAPVPAPPAGPANLDIRLHEVIQRADEDGLSYAKVFVGGQEQGRTAAAPRSQEKSWTGHVEPGNHPLRLELWLLPGLGAWERLPDPLQPRERFVRVEAGSRTRVRLRRHATDASYDFEVTREPL